MPWACSDPTRAMSYGEEREIRNAELRGNVPGLCVWELWFESVLPKSLFGVEDPTSARARYLGRINGVSLTRCLPCSVSCRINTVIEHGKRELGLSFSPCDCGYRRK